VISRISILYYSIWSVCLFSTAMSTGLYQSHLLAFLPSIARVSGHSTGFDHEIWIRNIPREQRTDFESYYLTIAENCSVWVVFYEASAPARTCLLYHCCRIHTASRRLSDSTVRSQVLREVILRDGWCSCVVFFCILGQHLDGCWAYRSWWR